MSYTTANDVRTLTGTNLDDTTINDLIAKADSFIDDELSRENLSVPNPTPSLISRASLYLSAALVIQRDWLSGATPESLKIGDLSKQTKIQDQISRLEELGKEFLKEYIRRSKFDESLYLNVVYEDMDEDDDES